MLHILNRKDIADNVTARMRAITFVIEALEVG